MSSKVPKRLQQNQTWKNPFLVFWFIDFRIASSEWKIHIPQNDSGFYATAKARIEIDKLPTSAIPVSVLSTTLFWEWLWKKAEEKAKAAQPTVIICWPSSFIDFAFFLLVSRRVRIGLQQFRQPASCITSWPEWIIARPAFSSADNYVLVSVWQIFNILFHLFALFLSLSFSFLVVSVRTLREYFFSLNCFTNVSVLWKVLFSCEYCFELKIMKTQCQGWTLTANIISSFVSHHSRRIL